MQFEACEFPRRDERRCGHCVPCVKRRAAIFALFDAGDGYQEVARKLGVSHQFAGALENQWLGTGGKVRRPMVGPSGYHGVHSTRQISTPTFFGKFRDWRGSAVGSSLEAAIQRDMYALECDGPHAVTNYPPAAYGVGEWE